MQPHVVQYCFLRKLLILLFHILPFLESRYEMAFPFDLKCESVTQSSYRTVEPLTHFYQRNQFVYE